MKPWVIKMGLLLIGLSRPFFLLVTRRYGPYFQSLRARFADPYLCGMVTHFNILHEWIFGPFFERVRMDPVELAYLKRLSTQGTLVYVMKNRGQLEYSFFNHRFLKEGIPLARFANGSRTLFWRPLSAIFEALVFRLDYYFSRGLLEDPIHSGYLENLVARGESALLNLKPSRELIFGTSQDSLEFITPLVLAAKKSEKPVYLVTQQFLYDRRPERAGRSLVDFLFGEKSNPGMIRKLILFVLSYRRRATVKFGEALDLKKFIGENQSADIAELADKLKNILLSHLMIERKSITGPLLQPRERILEKILRHKDVKDGLELIAHETGKSPLEMQGEVSRYFMEIAASVNYTYVDLYDRLIRWLVHNIYDGLDIDTDSLAKIKSIAGKYPIVLVPSHKSHIDYLLLSYIFYNCDLTLPHVCAGINLKFWGVSRLIRSGGGFFIRRSFRGNKVYKLVLEHYIKALVREGYSIEFFIEGTRSRVGKLLKPRMGILSMFMNAYLDGETPDIYFVPISINYERILEEKGYVREVHGSEKSRENVAGIFKARKQFRKKYGKVFIRFADPVSLKEFLGEKGIVPRARGVDECRQEVEHFAYQLTYHINRVSVVTSTSLVAAALLTFPKKGIPENLVLKRVKYLQGYLEYKGATLSEVIRQRGEWAYLEALQRLTRDRIILAHRDFSEKFYTIEDDKRPILDYHKNNSLHFFVSVSCLAKILQGAASTRQIAFDKIKGRYGILKRLLGQEFTFSQRVSLEEHLNRVIQYLSDENLISFDKDTQVLTFDGAVLQDPRFLILASLLDNYYESTYLTLTYMKHVAFEKMDKPRLTKAILNAGRVLYLKGDLRYPEALSRFNIGNALSLFAGLGFVQISKAQIVTRRVDPDSVHRWEEILVTLLGLGLPMKIDDETKRAFEISSNQAESSVMDKRLH